MYKDPTQRNDIRQVFQPGAGDFISSKPTCCKLIPETWDIDYHIWDVNDEFFDVTYYLSLTYT